MRSSTIKREKELQDACIAEADHGVQAAEADIAAAQAGVQAATSAIGNARSARSWGLKAEAARTDSERRRQEALLAAESATRQKVEQAVAEAERFRAQLASREDELNAAHRAVCPAARQIWPGRAPGWEAHPNAKRKNASVRCWTPRNSPLRAALNEKRAALKLARINPWVMRESQRRKGGSSASAWCIPDNWSVQAPR